MAQEDAAPCRHPGVPPEDVVNQVVELLTKKVVEDESFLRAHGLSQEEYRLAFSVAVERIRGRWAASNKRRREFAELVIKQLAKTKVIRGYDVPKYGNDTVYRLTLEDGKQIGIVQKGCPDGAHSSTRWTRPEWADELYLWWICSSLKQQPGEHIWKGVSRVQNKVQVEKENQLDGIIFFNDLCGTPERPCPKKVRTVLEDGSEVPPPCVYVFPHWDDRCNDLNWRGSTTRLFPELLLRGFEVNPEEASSYIGFVGFKQTGNAVRTELTSRFGTAKATTARG